MQLCFIIQDYKQIHQKTYLSSDEEAKSFAHYISNLKLADDRNLIEGDLIHGETIFSDLSPTEFRAMLSSRESRIDGEYTDLGKQVPFQRGRDLFSKSTSSARLESLADPSTLVDWSTGSNIYVSPVKDQVRADYSIKKLLDK